MNERITVNDEATYRSALNAIGIAATMIRQFDLPSLIQSMERADSLGCLIDPTLYMQGADKLREQRKLVEAAMPLWRFAEPTDPARKEPSGE